ncbi:MAG: hypothetical protein L0207_06140 [Chlamydiae bacterium]|nr:hypothetical protein [Chlamydiota bacterium]
MNLKSERLKKLENELQDLQQWMKLGLVPKKDLEKHQEEMRALEKKIKEERERLRFIKESGEMEEYVPPKRPVRPAFQEPSLPDMEIADENLTDAGLDMETETFEVETTNTGEETAEETEEAPAYTEEEPSAAGEDEDPFSDRNRWRRGVLEDPDADQW